MLSKAKASIDIFEVMREESNITRGITAAILLVINKPDICKKPYAALAAALYVERHKVPYHTTTVGPTMLASIS